MSDSGVLLHATAVLVGDRGVLITGASGSGKSSVANALIDRTRARGRFAALVGDDLGFVRAVSGRLVCTAPVTLRGGLEVRGAGLYRTDAEPVAIVHLVVQLVESAQAVRFNDGNSLQLEGVAVAQLILPAHEIDAACRAAEAALFHSPWNKFD
ncbi:MAG: HPr kinase/phosphorylase [Phyllobacterium sp.]